MQDAHYRTVFRGPRSRTETGGWGPSYRSGKARTPSEPQQSARPVVNLNGAPNRKNGHARRFFCGGRARCSIPGRSYPPGVDLKYRKRRSPGDRTTGATAARYPPHGSHARAKAPHKATGFSLSLQHPTPAGPATLRKEVPRTGAVNEAQTTSPIHTPPHFPRFPPARPTAHAICQTGATLEKTLVEGGGSFAQTGPAGLLRPGRSVGSGRRGAPPGGSLSERPGQRRRSAPVPPHRPRRDPRTDTTSGPRSSYPPGVKVSFCEAPGIRG